VGKSRPEYLIDDEIMMLNIATSGAERPAISGRW